MYIFTYLSIIFYALLPINYLISAFLLSFSMLFQQLPENLPWADWSTSKQPATKSKNKKQVFPA